MKKIRDFFNHKFGELIFIGLILLVFYFIFYLDNLDLVYYYFGLELIAICFVIYFIISFYMFLNRKDYKFMYFELSKEYENYRNDTIEDKKDLKDYFLMWVHQMKTPITASKLLLDQTNSRCQDIKSEIFKIDNYTEMAINYLKLRENSRDMDLTKVDLDKLISAVLKKYSIIFISNHISLDYTRISSFVISDYRWLSILIEQIISNSSKYTKNGKVKIIFDSNRNLLEIRDTGIGIRKEDLTKVFDMGYSGFNGRLNQKSSGLGLFLARKIADKLSIDLWLDSKLGDGTSVYLKFPEKN